MPDLPRNHKQPRKRMRESAAVAQRRAWKKRAVRSEEFDCSTRLVSSSMNESFGMEKAYVKSELVQIVTSDSHGKESVREDPGDDELGTETLVRIVQSPLLFGRGGNVRS